MTTIVQLSQGKHALISDEDAERVLAHKWSYHGQGYACRGVHYYVDGKRKTHIVLLHRFIVDAPPTMDVDHRNGDGLDCRRDNIRVATRVQNIANSGPRPGHASQYKGVQRRKNGRWFASIVLSGKTRYLGTYDCEEEAARVYDVAALAAWGEFAYINFPGYRVHYLFSLAIQRVHAVPTMARRQAPSQTPTSTI